MKVQFFDTLHSLGRSRGSGPTQRRLVTVAEVNRGHRSVLAQFRGKSGGWALTIDAEQLCCVNGSEPAVTFIQFVAFEDRRWLIGECVANQFLDEDHQLSADQQDCLRLFGWHEPIARHEPNGNDAIGGGR